MKSLKKQVVLVLVALVSVPLFGCSVGHTKQENFRSVNRVADYDTRMLVDDLALFMQTNRPFRGSRWIVE